MRTKLSVVLLAVSLSGAFAARGAVAPAGPIASAATNWKGVFLDLTSVERKGSVLTVKWTVRNEGAETARVQFGLTGEKVTTYVVDEENGTKYYALTDQEKHSLASENDYIGSNTFGIDDEIEPGGSRRFWMKLPAPPPAVKSLTLFFSEAEPFEEVPITDR